MLPYREQGLTELFEYENDVLSMLYDYMLLTCLLTKVGFCAMGQLNNRAVKSFPCQYINL